MEIIKSQLFLLLSLSLSLSVIGQPHVPRHCRGLKGGVSAAHFGLSQGLGKGVRPNFLGQGLEKLWSCL